MKKLTEVLAAIPLLLFGLIPSAALFIWVERNMALPWVGTWIGWPWVYVGADFWGALVFNLGLIGIYGLIHSFLAGRVARGIYVMIAGLSSFVLMAAWQHTGEIVYSLIPSAPITSLISFVLYWTFLGIALWSLSQVEKPTRFLGVEEPASSMNPRKLWTGGLYARVRHPLYTLTLAAWIITPMMSADRLIFIVGMSLYLVFGIRREERRMRETFGQAYIDYSARTPMLFPAKRKGPPISRRPLKT